MSSQGSNNGDDKREAQRIVHDEGHASLYCNVLKLLKLYVTYLSILRQKESRRWMRMLVWCTIFHATLMRAVAVLEKSVCAPTFASDVDGAV